MAVTQELTLTNVWTAIEGRGKFTLTPIGGNLYYRFGTELPSSEIGHVAPRLYNTNVEVDSGTLYVKGTGILVVSIETTPT